MAQSRLLLEQLPAEIGTIILHSIPDVQSLLAFIAASPNALRLYSEARDRIFISVVRNEIGEDLIRHAMNANQHKDRTYAPRKLTKGSCDFSLSDAKELYRAEKLTRSVIQACVDSELQDRVELSAVEWSRLRRGLYNLRSAAVPSTTQYADEFVDLTPFRQQPSTTDILEMLYILYCLRNSFARYLCSVDEIVVQEMVHGGFRSNFDNKYDSFFTITETRGRSTWNFNSPLTEDTDDTGEVCQVPACWTREWKVDPYFRMHIELIDRLVSFIPSNHTFDDVEGKGEGYRWLRQSLKSGIGYDYHDAIPLGFMIWDDKRLKAMDWMSRPPQVQPVPEVWETSCETYRRVEERFLQGERDEECLRGRRKRKEPPRKNRSLTW